MSLQTLNLRIIDLKLKDNIVSLYDNNGLFWTGRADYLSEWCIVKIETGDHIPIFGSLKK